VKGDVRINRKGRPKDFDALRKLAQQIAHEAVLKDGEPLVIAGHVVTTAELVMRSWAASREPQLQKGFVEIAYGKVPDEMKVSGSLDCHVVIDIGDGDAEGLPSGAAGDSTE
jgi:hypothetical protein